MYNIENLGNITELLQDLKAVFKKLTRRRKHQLFALMVLQIIGAASEVVSIGAVLPFLGALANANQLLTLPALKPWLNFIDVNSAAELITLMAVLFAFSIALVNLMRILISWAQSRLAAAINSDFSTEIFRRILFQSYDFHTKLNSGITVSVITNDLGSLMGVIRSFLMMITQGLVVFAIVGALVVYDALVALTMATLLLGAYTLFSMASRDLLLRNGKISSDKHMSMIKVIQDSFGGIRDIILDGTQHTFINIYSDADRAMRRARASSSIIISIPRFLLEVIGISVLCGFASVLAWQDKNLQEILPLIGGFSMAAIRLLPAMQRMYSAFGGMQGAHISMKRALTALERPLDPTCLVSSTGTYTLDQNISLENVWFSYSEAAGNHERYDWVLKDINMVIEANTTVALVGDTGGGKSTLADIILGLLYPQRGCVRVNGNVITEKSLYNWRQSIAHVPQAIFLSDNTIKENIAFGTPVEKIDMDRIKEVARLACLDDFIESRPLGYDEIVGERGIRLSGGQRQRIGIARALYKQASVIVFDEATSSLDNITEAEVMAAINNLSGKITMILIAHRLTTIRSADMVYEIRNGSVIGSGKFEELIESSNTFREMAKGIV